MKRILALVLSSLLLLSLVACDFDYQGKIVGTWICRKLDTNETKESLMDAIDLYDEEKALVTGPLYTAKVVCFKDDGSYYFTEDPDGVKQYVRDFYKQMFAQMYAGRASLVTTSAEYGTDLSQLTEEEFYKFYADLYSYASFEALLNGLAENVYDYDNFEPYERGTYTVGSKKINFDATTDADDGVAEYKVDGDKLTITYSDGSETYTKK